MGAALSDLRKVLESIEDELRRSPAFLNEGGKGVDDPAYFKETELLEALQARLSVAIKNLQGRPEPPGPQALELLKFARLIEREIQEVLANATEQLHQYHEMTAVPPELAYVPDVSAMHAGSVEAMCLFLFSVIAGYVQVRKRRKG
jgi:hypothetical protein